MKYATAVIGNSSSGIIEAPSFKIPTINIGDRQKGRVKAESVMDCEPAAISIASELRKAISAEFRAVLKVTKNPYEQADTAARIVEKITLYCTPELMKKSFYNLGRVV
jgi:GDP/UDP-N,N'-diacetylbacillosamine 2-epimerase (hydrolysing)